MDPIRMQHVQHWVNNEFREKLRDDEWVRKQMHIVVVGHKSGADLVEVMRRFLAGAVCDAAGVPITHQPQRPGEGN